MRFHNRHAETAVVGSNPNLSAAGLARATELQRILSNIPLAAIFSSDFNRTKQTAQPTATAKTLPVNLYDPLNQSPLVNTWLDTYRGKNSARARPFQHRSDAVELVFG